MGLKDVDRTIQASHLLMRQNRQSCLYVSDGVCKHDI